MSTELTKKSSSEVAENKSFSSYLMDNLIRVEDALPKNFNKERFVQNCVALLNDNPQLQKYSRNQIVSGLLKGSYLGLDFFSKECYLVPYGDSLNYQTDYRGEKKLAKKYSIRPIKDIYAKLVREGDEYEETIEAGKQSVYFKPKPFNNGKIIGAFAVCIFDDDGLICDSMGLEDLENTRKSSKASNSPAWKNFTGEMYKKTVLHRLCKQIELDFENPTQRSNFMSGMEIETDVSEIAHREIAENENSQPFEVVADVEAKEEPSFVTEG